MLNVRKKVMGLYGTNTYFIEDEDMAVLVDPAGKTEKIIEFLGNHKLIAIILTHGHLDHIKAVDDLYDKYKVPVYINYEDEQLARDCKQGQVFGLPYSPTITCPVKYLKEGLLEIGTFKFEVIFTPGHTKGSTCFKIDNYLFTGDTLFKESVGRTDLKGGSSSELKSSLRILKELDPSLIVCPGHDSMSFLQYEIDNNPYLRYL